MSRRTWTLVAVAATVAVAVQAGVLAGAWLRYRPRLPRLAAAVATLDAAITEVVAATGDTAAVAVTDLVPSASCQDTALAKGSRYTRTADLYTTPGAEDALVDRVDAALPAGDHPHRTARVGGGVAPLDADLGGDIQLRVTQLGQGWLAATAETGCRAAGRLPSAPAPPADGTRAIATMLAGLGTAPAGWHTDAVACGTGRMVTVDAISESTTTGDLPTRVAALVPPAAHRFASPANRLAWRDGSTSVIVAASDDGTHITVQRTVTC